MRRWQKILGGTAACVSLLLGAAYGYHKYRMASMMKLVDELPTFTNPAPGARAPKARAFGFQLGTDSLSDVTAAIGKLGLRCPDTSMRALMDQARAAKQQEIAAAKASGAGVDSVAGASMIYRRSPKERNPQVRLACDEATSHLLPDRLRADSTGRLLFVFDSAAHPLRHVSFTRSFRGIDDTLAVSEFQAASKAIAEIFGPGTDGGEEIELPMPRYKSYALSWKFSDLQATVRLMNMGDGRLSLDETIEVPWPVRADAPRS
jgi:hypothetical protein